MESGHRWSCRYLSLQRAVIGGNRDYRIIELCPIFLAPLGTDALAEVLMVILS